MMGNPDLVNLRPRSALWVVVVGRAWIRPGNKKRSRKMLDCEVRGRIPTVTHLLFFYSCRGSITPPLCGVSKIVERVLWFSRQIPRPLAAGFFH